MLKNLNKFNTFSNHSYRTRGRFLLRPKCQRTTVTQHTITYRKPKTWNSLPDFTKKYWNLSFI